MKYKMLLVITSLGVCFLSLVGCRGAGEAYAELLVLQNEVKQELQVENVQTQYQNFMCIGVAIVNSRFNEASEEEQQAARDTVIRLIDQHYRDREDITMVFVSFAEYRNWIVFSYSNSLNTRFYERDEQGKWVDKYGAQKFDNPFEKIFRRKSESPE